MVLFGVNFSVYFFLLRRRFRLAWHNSEVRWYFIIIFGAIVLISANLLLTGGFFPTVSQTIHHVAFSVGSVITTVIRGTMAFFICYAAIAVVSILLVSLDNFGAETSVTSVFATLNNIGPGLSLEVGPFGSYASFSALSKVVLTLDMLLGRLELFPVLLLLSPATWRKH